MNCRDSLSRLADRRDGLLAPEEEVALDEHLARCASCRDREKEFAVLRRHLYAAETMDPPTDLLDRIRAAARPRPRRVSVVFRYAAAFLAGVAVTLAFAPDKPVPSDPPVTVAVERAPVPRTEPSPDAPRVPRRIR